MSCRGPMLFLRLKPRVEVLCVGDPPKGRSCGAMLLRRGGLLTLLGSSLRRSPLSLWIPTFSLVGRRKEVHLVVVLAIIGRQRRLYELSQTPLLDT